MVASYFLWCFGLIGICGLHRLNAGRTWTGLLWLFTFGLLWVGQLIDLFLIPGFNRPATSGAFPENSAATPPDLDQSSHPPPPPEISWQQRLQSLVSEFGVSLLLILGFGLVILASGVLALTQWQNFSPAGQYLVLCSYTLLFWGLSLRALRTQLLQTQKALQLATLLLIPVNFWAMDGLQLWQSPWGLGTAVVAAILLSFAYIRLLARLQIRGWIWIPALALLYLNWGWTELETAIWALYVGLMGTTVLTVMRQRDPVSETEAPPAAGGFSEVQILLYSNLILLLRACFSEQILWSELGLAAGLGGWLLLQLPRPTLPPQVSYGLGWGCLSLGWILSVSLTPWQAFLVSGLALHVFGQRLQRQQLLGDLIAIFLVGLQGTWLLSRTLPLSWRETGLEWLQSWAGADLTFWGVWGGVGIPLSLGHRWG
ncbi:MAG: TM2 domain-containing protein, partial [Synechococcaceae cyanobacterium SM2_3_1]|nr:TM2 domain-containing protein [Synechococcaceae cyanobacterium SM2_3_1]